MLPGEDKDMPSDPAYHIAALFVKESIYRSIYRKGREPQYIKFFLDLFLPRTTDSILEYNLKWFIGGLLSGLFMAIWIPLFVMSSHYIGLAYTAELLLISYLVMVFIIAVIIVFDLIHQVTSAIKELKLWEPLERLPVDEKTIEKAASYSVFIGGGFSLILGIGVSVGLIVYIVTDQLLAVPMIPLGFITSIMIIYPIVLLLISRFGGSISNLVSLVVYVWLIVLAMSLYVSFVGLASPGEVYSIVYGYRAIYPFSYIYLSVLGYDVPPLLSALLYSTIGVLLSFTALGRTGLSLKTVIATAGKSHRLFGERIVSSALKDVYLLLRDRARSKQFYGQLAALLTPSIVPIVSPKLVMIIKGTAEPIVLFLFTLYGLLSYIIAVIVSPLLVFLEAENSRLLQRHPISRLDTILGKTLASLILYLPVIVLVSTLVLLAIQDMLSSILLLTSSLLYWVMGSLLSLFLVVGLLWNKDKAWTELSLGAFKRLIITAISITPLLLLVPLVFLYFILDVYSAIILTILYPVPIVILYIVLVKLRDRA